MRIVRPSRNRILLTRLAVIGAIAALCGLIVLKIDLHPWLSWPDELSMADLEKQHQLLKQERERYTRRSPSQTAALETLLGENGPILAQIFRDRDVPGPCETGRDRAMAQFAVWRDELDNLFLHIDDVLGGEVSLHGVDVNSLRDARRRPHSMRNWPDLLNLARALEMDAARASAEGDHNAAFRRLLQMHHLVEGLFDTYELDLNTTGMMLADRYYRTLVDQLPRMIDHELTQLGVVFAAPPNAREAVANGLIDQAVRWGYERRELTAEQMRAKELAVLDWRNPNRPTSNAVSLPLVFPLYSVWGDDFAEREGRLRLAVWTALARGAQARAQGRDSSPLDAWTDAFNDDVRSSFLTRRMFTGAMDRWDQALAVDRLAQAVGVAIDQEITRHQSGSDATYQVDVGDGRRLVMTPERGCVMDAAVVDGDE
ncbi:MAG: hypothetical protein H6684_12545 [Deltaproteobacteria bacterium]|nr:hypothetical protein [Deltaproteobacteria bacterium]